MKEKKKLFVIVLFFWCFLLENIRKSQKNDDGYDEFKY